MQGLPTPKKPKIIQELIKLVALHTSVTMGYLIKAGRPSFKYGVHFALPTIKLIITELILRVSLKKPY